MMETDKQLLDPLITPKSNNQKVENDDTWENASNYSDFMNRTQEVVIPQCKDKEIAQIYSNKQFLQDQKKEENNPLKNEFEGGWSLNQIISDAEQRIISDGFAQRQYLDLKTEFVHEINSTYMTKCKIDYLPFVLNRKANGFEHAPIENAGEITNYLVKRIFKDFRLILELWKVKIDLVDPVNSEAVRKFQSIVNEVPGRETHPSYIDYSYSEGKITWFTIDHDWLEDSCSIKQHVYDILEEDEETFTSTKFTDMPLDKVERGNLVSILIPVIWNEKQINVPIYKRRTDGSQQFVFIYEKSWIDIYHGEFNDLESFEEQELKGMPERLSFDFYQAPVVMRCERGCMAPEYQNINRADAVKDASIQPQLFINLGGGSSAIHLTLFKNFDPLEYQHLGKVLKRLQQDDQVYDTIMNALQKRMAKHTSIKGITSNYQEFISLTFSKYDEMSGILSEMDEGGLRQHENKVGIKDLLGQQVMTCKFMKNLNDQMGKLDKNQEGADYKCSQNQGLSIFVCYVGQPYIQIIRPKNNPEEGQRGDTNMTHELIYFGLEKFEKNNISINDASTPLKYGDIISISNLQVDGQKKMLEEIYSYNQGQLQEFQVVPLNQKDQNGMIVKPHQDVQLKCVKGIEGEFVTTVKFVSSEKLQEQYRESNQYDPNDEPDVDSSKRVINLDRIYCNSEEFLMYNHKGLDTSSHPPVQKLFINKRPQGKNWIEIPSGDKFMKQKDFVITTEQGRFEIKFESIGKGLLETSWHTPYLKKVEDDGASNASYDGGDEEKEEEYGAKFYTVNTADLYDFHPDEEYQPIIGKINFQKANEVQKQKSIIVLYLLDLVSMKFKKAEQVERVFDSDVVDIKDIDICQSSPLIKRSSKIPKKVLFERSYQILCKFSPKEGKSETEQQIITMDEYKVQWAEKMKGKDNNVEVLHIGAKFMHRQEPLDSAMANEWSLKPLFDTSRNDYKIHGYKLMLKSAICDESQVSRQQFYQSFDFPNDKFMFDSQCYTKSGVREFKSNINTVVAEVQLSDMVQATYDQFTTYERSKIMRDQLINVLNTVSFNIIGILQRNDEKAHVDCKYSTKGYSHLKPLEILGGKSLINAQLMNPSDIDECLNGSIKDCMRYQKYSKSALERNVGGNSCPSSQDMKYLIAKGYLYAPAKPFLFLDIQQKTILEQTLEYGQLNSTKIIIDFMMEQGMDQSHYEMMMRCLLLATENDAAELFVPFLSKQVESISNKKVMGQLNIEIDIVDERLSRFGGVEMEIIQYTNGDLEHGCNKDILEQMIELDVELCANKEFELDHMFIDFRTLILQRKLETLIKMKSLSDRDVEEASLTHYEVSQLMDDLFDQCRSNIEDMQVMRNIIDYQFDYYTYKYFVLLSQIFVVTYICPFIVQIFSVNWTLVLICNISCFFSQLFFFYVELIQIRHDPSNYFTDPWNRVDFSFFVLNLIYSVLRFPNLGESYSPLAADSSRDSGLFVPMVLLHLILIMQSMMKMMSYLRVFESFGQLVQLLLVCIQDIKTFSAFLSLWIFTFTVMYLIIGLEVDDGDYSDLSRQLRTALQAYRNSIGDLSAPLYKMWIKSYEAGEISYFYVKLMEFTIWGIWFFNQFIVLIILLNFLIAIISQSYEMVMTSITDSKYEHRSDLNRECYLTLKYFNILYEYDTLIIYSRMESAQDQQQNEWLGFVTTIKNFITKQNYGLQKYVNNRMNALDEGLTTKIQSMQTEMSGDFDTKLENVTTQISSVKDEVTGVKKDMAKVRDDLANIQKNVNNQIQSQVSTVIASIADIKTLIEGVQHSVQTQQQDPNSSASRPIVGGPDPGTPAQKASKKVQKKKLFESQRLRQSESQKRETEKSQRRITEIESQEESKEEYQMFEQTQLLEKVSDPVNLEQVQLQQDKIRGLFKKNLSSKMQKLSQSVAKRNPDVVDDEPSDMDD